ncbi:MAG: hypothetical protein ACK56I_14400, partial [bacterium]
YSYGSYAQQRYLRGIEQDIFQQRYLEILQYIQKTLAIAMSQHDRLGEGSLLQPMSPDILKVITDRLKPRYS